MAPRFPVPKSSDRPYLTVCSIGSGRKEVRCHHAIHADGVTDVTLADTSIPLAQVVDSTLFLLVWNLFRLILTPPRTARLCGLLLQSRLPGHSRPSITPTARKRVWHVQRYQCGDESVAGGKGSAWEWVHHWCDCDERESDKCCD